MVIEDMYPEERPEAIKGKFSMVAIDDERKPTKSGAIKIAGKEF